MNNFAKFIFKNNNFITSIRLLNVVMSFKKEIKD